MPRPLPEYHAAERALISILHNLPSKIVAIDGLNGTGKTTLARYLAYKFNCSLLETDLFMISPAVNYHFDEMSRIIEYCRKRKRPIIVEGVAILRTLKTMGLSPAYHIYWENIDPEDLGVCRVDRLGVELLKYRRDFKPTIVADLCIKAVIKNEL